MFLYISEPGLLYCKRSVNKPNAVVSLAPMWNRFPIALIMQVCMLKTQAHWLMLRKQADSRYSWFLFYFLQSMQDGFVLPLAVCRNVSRSMQHTAARHIHVPRLHMVSLGVFINALRNTWFVSLFAVDTDPLTLPSDLWIWANLIWANHNKVKCAQTISAPLKRLFSALNEGSVYNQGHFSIVLSCAESEHSTASCWSACWTQVGWVSVFGLLCSLPRPDYFTHSCQQLQNFSVDFMLRLGPIWWKPV